MLGKGGGGVVYLVLHLSGQQFYALKTFRDEFMASAAAREAFKRELSVWVSLGKHPNILELYKVFEYCGRLFVEMECVVGRDGRISLRDHLKQSNGPLDPNQSLEWAIQFCFGMEHARALGVICHQDIKPGNILITSKGTIKIADFGLAAGAALGRRAQGAGGGSFVSGGKEGEFGLSLVQVGGRQVCGTPGYIAPEVYRGESGDERSDVYSFGLVLAQMANGSPAPPFGGQHCPGIENYLEVIYRQQMAGLLPRVKGPLRSVIGKCLQAEPSQRYGGFRDLRSDLEKILRERTGRTVPAPVADAGTVIFWNHKGVSLTALGRADEAIACFDRVLAIEPLAAENWYNKGDALYELGRHKEAWGCFEEALRLDANFAQAWSGKGVCYAHFGHYMEAIRCYDKALAINPKDFAVWNNRGMTLSELGRRDEAITNFDKALALDPRNAIGWFQKAKTLLKLRRDCEAIRCLDNALAINPRYANAWLWKAKTEQTLGHLREARQSYRNYIAVAPAQSNEIAFAQQQLHELG
jgi:tetratricopeptide (TPR) repeat protein